MNEYSQFFRVPSWFLPQSSKQKLPVLFHPLCLANSVAVRGQARQKGENKLAPGYSAVFEGSKEQTKGKLKRRDLRSSLSMANFLKRRNSLARSAEDPAPYLFFQRGSESPGWGCVLFNTLSLALRGNHIGGPLQRTQPYVT